MYFVFLFIYLFFKKQKDEPPYYYWECIEMTKKCLLIGAIQLIGSGTTVQLLFGILVCMFHLMVVLKLAPYESDKDDVLQFLVSVAFTLTLLLGFATKSDPNHDTYGVFAMDVLLTTMNVLVLVIGVAIIIILCPCLRKLRCMRCCGVK